MAVEIDEPVVIQQVNYYEVVGRTERYSEEEAGMGDESPKIHITLSVLEGFVEEDGSITHVRIVDYPLGLLGVETEVESNCQVRSYRDEIMARNYDLAVSIGAIPET